MRVKTPNRVTRRYSQALGAPPEEVFPLLCPVREVEWVDGWNPRFVLSRSGVAEPGCIFVTPGEPQDAIWLVAHHDPEACRLELIKVVPGVVIGSIEIQLTSTETGSSADIAYTFTALGSDGDKVLEGFTQEHFDAFMITWEDELNHFLRTGSKLGPR